MSDMTRREQREKTREALLDATIQCLVEFGHAGTTTQRIQDRAGVSRGALSHHFPSKSELLAEATHRIAVKHLQRVTDLIDRLDGGPEALPQLLHVFRDAMTEPHFQASIEIWTASRTDPQLQAALLPAEREFGAAIRAQFMKHAGITDSAAAHIAFESLMALMRGLELTRLMRPDSATADLVLESWLDYVLRLRGREGASN